MTSGQPVVLLEANLDDVTGEILAHAVAALLGAGALDAWITPIDHEEGAARPTWSAPCATRRRPTGCVAVLMAETGTLGVRGAALAPLARPAARSTRSRSTATRCGSR